MATIYKRGKVWWARFQHAGQEHRRSTKATARAVAQKLADKWEQDIKTGGRPELTFNEAMSSFMDNHMPTLKPSSQKRYISSIKMMLPHFDGMLIAEINGRTLSQFESRRRLEGAKAPTIRRDLACLSSMFSHLIYDLEATEDNPAHRFMKGQAKRRRLRESPPNTRYLFEDEEARLLAACPKDLANQIAFAIDTGLRSEEMWGLTWDRVRLGRNEVLITKELAKGSRERAVPLLPRSAQILAQLPRHLRMQETPDYVFCKQEGQRYTKRIKGLKTYAAVAGCLPLTWHDLRRTCGCRLLQVHKLPLEQIRDWLGHESVQQTERAYAFLAADALHKGIADGTKTGTGDADYNSASLKDVV